MITNIYVKFLRFIRPAVRYCTGWAWYEEVNFLASSVHLKELHATPGAINAEIELEPERAVWMAQCLASLVKKSPNYTEIQFEVEADRGTANPQRIIVLIQKLIGKSPHDLKREAETRSRDYRAALEQVEQIVLEPVSTTRIARVVGVVTNVLSRVKEPAPIEQPAPNTVP